MSYVVQDKSSGSVVANGKSSTFTEVFNCVGIGNAGQAIAAVRSSTASLLSQGAPPVVDGWSLNAVPRITTEPLTGINDWRVTVLYKVGDKDDDDNKDNLNENPWPGEVNNQTEDEPEGRISFTFGGTTANTALSKDYDYYWVDGKPQPNPRDIIGYGMNMNSDGEFEGIDIVVPSCQINIEKTFKAADFTNAKLKEFFGYIGKTNSNPWRTLEPNCVLLTGIDGAQNSEGNWPLNFTFDYRAPYYVSVDTGNNVLRQANGQAAPVQPDLGGANQLGPIRGHFYTWFYYHPSVGVDGQPDEQSRNFSQVRVNRVYDNFDFSLLGID